MVWATTLYVAMVRTHNLEFVFVQDQTGPVQMPFGAAIITLQFLWLVKMAASYTKVIHGILVKNKTLILLKLHAQMDQQLF